MTWNYRVIREVVERDEIFNICEVFYDSKGEINGWTNPVRCYGTSLENLSDDINKQSHALLKPVLEEVDGKLLEVKGD